MSNSSSARRIATGVAGVHAFEAPPAKMDLLRASADELHQFGIPHRPDPKKMPQAFRHWVRVIRSVRKVIVPKLIITPNIVHGPIRSPKPASGGSPQLAGPSYNWSGLVCFAAPPYTQIWAHWTVPHVAPPPNGNATYQGSIFVGMGGFGAAYDPENLLQAGTYHITGTGPSENYAWIEWYPAAQMKITNFPISPGDPISVDIYPDGTGVNGICTMVNLATGYAFSVQIDPPTLDYNGNVISPPIKGPSKVCAEWIIERPSNVLDGVVTRDPFVDYGELSMTDATAISYANGGKTLVSPTQDPNAVSLSLVDLDGTTVLSDEAVIPAIQFYSTQTTIHGLPY